VLPAKLQPSQGRIRSACISEDEVAEADASDLRPIMPLGKTRVPLDRVAALRSQPRHWT